MIRKAQETKMTTEKEANEVLSEMGFSLESSPASAGADNMLEYTVRIRHNGNLVIAIPYRMGIGFVDLKKPLLRYLYSFTANEEAMFYAWKKSPYANFKDKALQLRVAVKLANSQKVKPQLANVLHSLMLDGEAFFNAQSFEDWAGEFGYDQDSRKAEATYRECDRIGRILANKLDKETIRKVQNITANI
jgi:hypothetical protein